MSRSHVTANAFTGFTFTGEHFSSSRCPVLKEWTQKVDPELVEHVFLHCHIFSTSRLKPYGLFPTVDASGDLRLDLRPHVEAHLKYVVLVYASFKAACVCLYDSYLTMRRLGGQAFCS